MSETFECVIRNDDDLNEVKKDLKNQFKMLKLSKEKMQEALESGDMDEYDLWLDDYYFNRTWINTMKKAIKQYEGANK